MAAIRGQQAGMSRRRIDCDQMLFGSAAKEKLQRRRRPAEWLPVASAAIIETMRPSALTCKTRSQAVVRTTARWLANSELHDTHSQPTGRRVAGVLSATTWPLITNLSRADRKQLDGYICDRQPARTTI
jgi:hypothetical protein